MLMADDRSNLWSSEDYSLEADDLRDDLTIDIGTILDILNENPDSSEVNFDQLYCFLFIQLYKHVKFMLERSFSVPNLYIVVKF